MTGADGYVMLGDRGLDIPSTIRRILAGGTCFAGAVTRALERQRLGPPGLAAMLAAPEWEIVRAIGAGKSSGQIATELRLSLEALAQHRLNILRKLRLRDGRQLVKFCARVKAASTRTVHLLVLFPETVVLARELVRIAGDLALRL